jgi:hypothetical protein
MTEENHWDKKLAERIKQGKYDPDPISLTGHRKSWYKNLLKEMEQKFGKRLIGSIGFKEQKLFTSSVWVNVYLEDEKFDSIEEIKAYYENFQDICGEKVNEIIIEHASDELRVWFVKKKSELTE